MKRHNVLAALLCFAITSCDRTSNPTPAAGDVKSQSTTSKTLVNPPATLSGVFKTYCVYQLDAQNHPHVARTAVIGLKAETVGGWETANPVPMDPITHSGSCRSMAHFNTKDELSIAANAQRDFTLTLKLSNVTRGPYALSAGEVVNGHALWYYTTTATSDGYAYYVYMEDSPGPAGKKVQRYRVEAFLVGTTNSDGTPGIPADTPACLAERPEYKSNVFPVPNKEACDDEGSQENSIGAGNEPT